MMKLTKTLNLISIVFILYAISCLTACSNTDDTQFRKFETILTIDDTEYIEVKTALENEGYIVTYDTQKISKGEYRGVMEHQYEIYSSSQHCGSLSIGIKDDAIVYCMYDLTFTEILEPSNSTNVEPFVFSDGNLYTHVRQE